MTTPMSPADDASLDFEEGVLVIDVEGFEDDVTETDNQKCGLPPKSGFVRDIAEHMSKHSSEVYRYQCGACPAKFVSLFRAAMHMHRVHHDNIAATPIDLMDNKMKESYKLLTMIYFPAAVEAVQEWCGLNLSWKNKESYWRCLRKLVTCQVCKNDGHWGPKQMIPHVFTHMSQRPFKCGLCQYTGLSICIIRNHIANKHAKVPLKVTIGVENNNTEAFLDELKSLSAQCYPDYEKQLISNFGFIFRSSEELDRKLVEARTAGKSVKVSASKREADLEAAAANLAAKIASRKRKAEEMEAEKRARPELPDVTTETAEESRVQPEVVPRIAPFGFPAMQNPALMPPNYFSAMMYPQIQAYMQQQLAMAFAAGAMMPLAFPSFTPNFPFLNPHAYLNQNRPQGPV
ncbi:unnamed protein product, partial [Mesorhabditis spiculigera]